MRFLLAGLFVAGLVRAVVAQPTPAFEVATIKPSGPDSPPMSIQRQPGRLITSNTPLSMLIRWAFNLDDGRLLGVPPAADGARFDVLAKSATENLRAGELQLMMRTLLIERFGLVVHQEKRTLTSFALLVDGNGLKVAVANPPETPDANPFSMTTAGTLRGRRVTTDMLTKALSSQLGIPIDNATTITGSFDFTLMWQPDGVLIDDAARPSLFTALREQLGLRLESRRVPLDVIVIDKLSLTPTPN